ncbi:transglutaminaseTgpA domain-containing protein [Cytobacillus solani]|uniref:transglutaminaseTgpA domain-containing protein n=1 Tax=Cytobacillus solani TaxID=1637975 RepID=UPI00207A5D48|nr:transglutaminaseTgpA domain-containing protein [Cytobacillus solani]USK55553.1 transglutaminaseTgpA domain-containing protein [Cytobacillus solani]
MTSRKVQKDLMTFIMYIFGFLLLWEWLRPLEQLTDTSNIWVFLSFIFISLLLSFIGTPVIIGGCIKWVFIIAALDFLYIDEAFFQFKWVSVFITDFIESFQFVMARDWANLSNLFRSFLFFVLLWLMTYLIQYWLINRKQIFIFFFMTLVYITVLDTFTPYNAGWAIVRTVISGFAVLGMLTFFRLLDKEGIKKETNLSRKWMIPLVAMIVVSIGFGLAAPKAEPIWPDPVPYLTPYGKESGDGTGVQKIGYGLDDSSLGGPFIGDNQVVFTVEAESRHYWKVETKDVYTGKGWITSGSREVRSPFGSADQVPITSFFNRPGVETVKESSTVYSLNNNSHIVYPLGIKKIDAASFFSFELEVATEKIHSLEGDSPSPIKQYTLDYVVPRYSVTALNEASSEKNIVENNELINRYTQLPKDLPQRIQELAKEITDGKDSWFEKARELESYFSRSGYSYDQKDVAVPGDDEDYVDQFLFDTKQGYCDNFSTSMVVMARSIGIPARWVKGYTEGEYKGISESGSRMFEITNNNAHSWVEVYFPGIGWVPFEPTQGFSNSVQFNFDTASQSHDQPSVMNPEELEKDKPELKENNERQAASSEGSFKKLFVPIKNFFEVYWKWIALVIIVLAVLALIIYKIRGRWLPYYLTLRFKWTKKDENFQKAYMLLLRELERYGLHRKDGQTLRDYADYVDRFFSSREMGRLTARYEQLIYRGNLQKGSWKETKELWENLIKKTIA